MFCSITGNNKYTMANKIGRNDPCSCGSGKKYKKCCQSKEVSQSSSSTNNGGYHFSPGSYGDPIRGFMPSIACQIEKKGGEKSFHFVLIKPDTAVNDEDEASFEARDDLELAFSRKQPTDQNGELFAAELKELGYIKVNDFKVVA